MQFYVMTRTHVRQLTLVHVAKCHSTISWIMSSYFSHEWFQGDSMCIDRRQSAKLCPYHMGMVASKPVLLVSQCKSTRTTKEYVKYHVKSSRIPFKIVYSVFVFNVPVFAAEYQDLLRLHMQCPDRCDLESRWELNTLVNVSNAAKNDYHTNVLIIWIV